MCSDHHKLFQDFFEALEWCGIGPGRARPHSKIGRLPQEGEQFTVRAAHWKRLLTLAATNKKQRAENKEQQ